MLSKWQSNGGVDYYLIANDMVCWGVQREGSGARD